MQRPLNPIRPGVLDPGKFPGHKVPGFNLGALNLCLSLEFGVCIENYVQLDKIKKKFQNDREIKFSKKISTTSKILCHRENVRHSAKCQYFELQFFANILICIVLNDSAIKIWGYRRSWGVTFENFEIFWGNLPFGTLKNLKNSRFSIDPI